MKSSAVARVSKVSLPRRLEPATDSTRPHQVLRRRMPDLAYNVRVCREGILVEADYETARYLVGVLEVLGDLARWIERKARVREAEERAMDPVRQAETQEKFHALASKAFSCFKGFEHLGREAAVKKVRVALGMRYSETQFLIREGKKLSKAKKPRRTKTPQLAVAVLPLSGRTKKTLAFLLNK